MTMTPKTTTLSRGTETRQLTSQDLFKIQIIEDCRISPGGEMILFTLKSFKPDKNEYESRLFSIPFKGGEKRPFTQGPHDGSPAFSPDGKEIAFLRKAGDHAQIFVIPRDGGEARQLTRFKSSAAELSWSPDGRFMLFSSFVTEKGLIAEDEKPEEDHYKKYNADVKIIDRIWYKLDGKGYLHDKRSHLFTLNVESGEVKQITSGNYDCYSPRFSPNGRQIAFTSNRDSHADYEPFAHICLVSSEGGSFENLTPGEYLFTCPSFSPDGKTIAFVGTDEPKNFYASPRLWLIPAKGGKPECLTRTPDLPVTDQSINDLRAFEHGGEFPKWDSTGENLYISRSEAGKVYLVSLELKSKKIREFAAGNHVMHGWDTAAQSNQAVVVIGDPVTPNDLWSLTLSNGNLQRLTEINAPFLAGVSISAPESLSVKSKDGTLVEGWILKPPGFQEGKKYPAVLEIHGGPMAMYAWSFFFEFQLLANQGYVVAYSNPRGSMGYGQPFCQSIKADWGNLDYQDIMSFWDGVIARGFVDEKRTGVLGGSYGGFMTNWIVGKTQRFKAAVTMRSVTNEASMFGTSDGGYFHDYHHGDLPWTNNEHYRKISPITYVANIRTPLLIIHSEDDLRCPIEQAEQLYASLKKLKQEVLFVRFPGESHDLSRTGKPWHRIFRLNQIVSWFEKHL